MKKVEETIDVKVPTAFEIKKETRVRYVADDGHKYATAREALNRDTMLKKEEERQTFLASIEKIECEYIDSVFLPEGSGAFYKVLSEEHLDQLFIKLFIRKPYKANQDMEFPCWVYINEEDGGDSAPWVTFYNEEEILDSIEKTRVIFDKILGK